MTAPVVKLILAATLAAAVHAAAAGERPASSSLDDLSALTPRSQREQTRDAQEELRAEIVRDGGLVAGTQGGYSQRAGEIHAILARRAGELDRIYNFVPLMFESGRVISPVIELVDDVQAVEGDGSALRETNRVLRVVRPARLVTAAPTWRDYLTIGSAKLERPDDGVLPRSGSERDIWRSAVAEGWAQGRRQADLVYQTQLEELTQAYEGMLRYRDLLAQGMIEPAKVGQSDLGIVRQDGELRIGDTLYTLKAGARFSDPKAWRPVVTPSTGSESSSAATEAGR